MKGTMKKALLALIFFYSTNAYAGIVVCESAGEVTKFDVSSPPQSGCEYYTSGQNITDAQDSALRTLQRTQPLRYLKMLNGFPVEKSPAEKVAADDALAAQIQADTLSSSRSGAKESVDQLSPEGVRLRAALLLTLDEINNLRQWIDAFKAQVALASNLTDLKTKVASLPSMPDRTTNQVKTAIKGKIDAGSAD